MLQLLSPPFLMTSTRKQMRPNGRGGADKQTDRQTDGHRATAKTALTHSVAR